MKIFSAAQIRKCDDFTMTHEPVTSLNLMERAAKASVAWISEKYHDAGTFYIFCGNGNNGGDGFAIARLLYEKGFNVDVFLENLNAKMSGQTEVNFKKVKAIADIVCRDFKDIKNIQVKENSVIIDALFGTGLNRKIEGVYAEIIQVLNEITVPKIAIDIPSGLFADKMAAENAVIFNADDTLSFQFWKKSFLHPETGKFCGNVHILDIGLSRDFIKNEPSDDFVSDETLIQEIYRPRNDFSHKGNFGKTTIVAGSFGKTGAAVLATKAALRTGSGITVTRAPRCGYEILQTTCSEAMFLAGGDDFVAEIFLEDDFVAGIGPGLGTGEKTEKALLRFLKDYCRPLVLDADALNMLAENTENIKLIPKNSIITPHPKEFERLFGKTADSFERLELGRKKAAELQIFIVLKDHHTQVITPANEVYYNLTGNSGMAKGGSGDVLLGIITSLLAQNYSPKNAAIFGVWLHGKAGDFAAEKFSKEAMLPGDLIGELGNVFKILA